MVLIHRVEHPERMALIASGALLIGLGFALMPLGTSAAWVAATIAIWTLGETLALPVLNVVAADRTGAAHRGRYLGLHSMACSLAFLCAPAVGTWIYEHQRPDALGYCAAAATAPLGLAFALLRRGLSGRPAAAGHALRE